VTSCPFRVTLGLSSATLASRSKTLGLPRPLDQATRATWHTTASKVSIKCWVTSRVTEVTSWAFQGLHHSEEGKTPSGSRPARLSLVERPPFSLVQTSDLSLPLVGVSTSIWWDFSPMEVRTNHLPMCTYPSGVALQQQKVHPPWARKSQDHSNVNHI
jgi:hypothetical protein